MPDQPKLELTRDQIARIVGNDPRAIAQFERLFSIVGALESIVVSERIETETNNTATAATTNLQNELRALTTSADMNSAQIGMVLAKMSKMNQRLEYLETERKPAPPRHPSVDYIDFTTSAPGTYLTGRVKWNATDETLNIYQSNEVILQVGLEELSRFTNNTGAIIPNGTSVGLQYSGGVTLANVVPYLADGATPTLNILGVVTENVAIGAMGRITLRGLVRDIDTTAWAVGDVLYASTTVAGGLQNTKPTAPQTCIPIAIVLFVHATAGIISVRPTVEQQENYSVVSDSTDQSHAATYTPKAVTLNTTDFAQGFTIVTSTKITAAQSGLYDFKVRLQVTNTNAAQKSIYIWPRKNGADVANSLEIITISGNGATVVPAWNYVISMTKNDYVEFFWAVDDTNVTLDATAAAVGAVGTAAFARPACPSVIITVTQVAQ